MFYKNLFKNFRNIGACAPSTQYLAAAIAHSLPENFQGMLLELGVGTGNITRGLLKRKIAQKNIIGIESSIDFIQFLRPIYPGVTFIHGDAKDLSKLIKHVDVPIAAIVSSLPLRAMKKDSLSKIINQIDLVLMPGGYYIQYTYFMKKNPIATQSGYRHVKSRYVWANFPPARVDVFKKIAYAE